MTLSEWVTDYLHAIRGQSNAILVRKPPRHYLDHVTPERSPVVLIPGIFETWNVLRPLADTLSLEGHPIYVIEHLGYNTTSIARSAQLIRDLIDEKKLKDVVLLAHSKGGLVGKYVLAFFNQDNKVRRLIAIATPFEGTRIIKYLPQKSAKELGPDSEIVKLLLEEKEVNKKVVSIFALGDNHVWPVSSCHLEGAENIEIKVNGHHKILFVPEVKKIVIDRAGQGPSGQKST